MLEDIEAHARRTAPAECCGLLIGTAMEVVDSVRSANGADDPTRRFRLDPATHLEALRMARARGLAVVGFYHPHPVSEPTLSPADVEGASYPDHLYLIVRPLASGCQGGFFRLTASGFATVEIDLDERSGSRAGDS